MCSSKRRSAAECSSVVLLLITLMLSACESRKSQGEPTMNGIPIEEIRQPAVAGSWYPDEPTELRGELENYLDEAQDFQLGDIVALVSPHAGYVYSGPVAAYAYRQIEGKQYDAVVVVAPSHAEAFPFTSIYGRGAYKTPLGLIPVDSALAKMIAEAGNTVKISDRGHRQERLARQEHSLEIQLPFLQITLGEFKLVPIVMGDQTEEMVHDLAQALAKALKNRKVLLVASSDLSHFHSYDEAVKLDKMVLKSVEEYNPNALLGNLSNHKVEACGGGPICAVMEAARLLGANRSRVLRYANSGDVPAGDRYRVVGYMAAAFYRDGGEEKKAPNKPSRGDAKPLSREDKEMLLKIARTTIESVVLGARVPEFQVTSEDLLQDRGAFVTITKKGALRGCIGYIIGVKPLYQTVREVAESAALRDPRFEPVQPSELPDLKIEISALSVPRRIQNIEEITVGVHGIIIRKGYRQGLLLPQVATEYGWDRNTFLEHTCRKAGLPPNAWQDEDTEIEIFSAEVFGEDD
jgi:AmmeMemoRadiSam system protein B/AmmeMemoRadiSam system protein A